MIDVVFEFKEVYGFYIGAKLNHIPRKGEDVYLSDELLDNKIDGDFEVLKVTNMIIDSSNKNYVNILLIKI